MSKIEANKLELEHSAFNLKSTIDKIVSVNTVKIDEKSQKLTVEYDDAIPHTLIGDETRVSQIITNLFYNAIKFTPAGGEIKIIAKLELINNESAKVEFAVVDNGIGIAYEMQGKLFNLFEQLDGGNNRQHGGTGLGLAISKKFVELMNGTIWVESKAGEGSAFMFLIPFAYETDKTEENRRAAHYGLILKTVFPRKKMLLAEDIEINAEIFLALLAGTAIEIDVVGNGLEAVNMFKAHPEKYDIIFTDIQMPVMDGYEATRQIRALDIAKARTVPIIAMTANAFKEDIDRCIKAGMNSHCSKPINIDEIIRALNTYLG